MLDLVYADRTNAPSCRDCCGRPRSTPGDRPAGRASSLQGRAFAPPQVARNSGPTPQIADLDGVGTEHKILSLAEAEASVRAAQRGGKTVALCHGCFDIVHPGHVRHLQHAAKLGDRLLVTISGDSMVDKGTGRPLIPQELRAESLAALDCVDWVAVNPEPTAADLLHIIRPDIYVKGREYEHNRDPRFQAEKHVVESYGGRVVFSSGDVVFSSTALINAMEQTVDPAHSRLRQLIAQQEIDVASVDQFINSFRGKRVVVVGETIIDTYVMCNRPEVAGEAPLMTLRPVEYRSFDGGAAIIAKHLAAMGARPTMITALPSTPETAALRQRLARLGIETQAIEHAGPLIEKQRFNVGSIKVMKLDLGEPITLDATGQSQLKRMVQEAANQSEAVIIADFGQGLFTDAFMTEMCELLRPCTDLLVGDVSGRRSNLRSMHGMDLLCPSELEIREALHDYDEGLTAVVWRLLHATNTRSAIITLGADGLIAFDRAPGAEADADDWQTRLTAEHVPALVPYAIDQLGCGDALLAAATLTRVCGGSLTLAALLGAVAAAAQSQQLGNAVIGAVDLRKGIRRLCEAQLTYVSQPEAELVCLPRDQLHLAHT